ncbi:hypothetical protein QN379_19225 [Glaciimonas sp. Gout2]|uniref:hypothetical protein n=1 Tax=unclassified Glaciimonas TaxID=2644401 RepID=UPI002AB3AD2A|nr:MULTISPECIES: hypothetical protein [unclassified Glaciimonas]MDY7548884.1 hypothetical protein [Glaciimonas sp. CA11.2]MEB0012530.1 hypothetical protein [Glaciimonas sp. Cout2]MEB0084144.1 hypothetical protein [Glaciimonas sp. Gout2]
MPEAAFFESQAGSIGHRAPTPVPAEEPPLPGPGPVPSPEEDPVPDHNPSNF